MTISSAVSALTGARRAAGAALLRPGNLLPAAVWLFLVVSQVSRSSFPPPLPTVLLVFINSVAVALFMARRDATKVGNSLETALALAGTFIVAFLEVPGARRIDLLAGTVQIVALFGWAAALLSLGRSFGIVPADRGLVRHGLYGYIRHPMYAFEGLFLLGFLLSVPTWRSLIIIAVWWALQIARIVREERILAGYDEYRRRVRWRLLPGVW